LTKFPERKWLTNFTPLHSQPIPTQPTHITFSPQSYELFLTQAHEEAVKILEQNQKKLKKINSKGSDSQAAAEQQQQQSLTSAEVLRWFILPTDFLGSAPVIDLGAPYSPQELKGAIKPNAFFYETTHHLVSNPSLEGHNARSPYVEKRDQKLVSSTQQLTKQPPRYLFVEHLVGTSSKHSLPAPAPAPLPPKEIKSREEAEPLDHLPSKDSAPSTSPPSKECPTGVCSTRKDVSVMAQTPTPEGSVGPGMLGGNSTSFPPTSTPLLADPGAPLKPKAILPPKKILKSVGQAIGDWAMIEEGDRLLLGLSGGKDSLALLHILLHVQKKAPINFTLACATVDPQTESFDPSPLIPYVQSLGVSPEERIHFLAPPSHHTPVRCPITTSPNQLSKWRNRNFKATLCVHSAHDSKEDCCIPVVGRSEDDSDI
jgi:hypothetical protein